jgi:hypothetical protein
VMMTLTILSKHLNTLKQIWLFVVNINCSVDLILERLDLALELLPARQHLQQLRQ